LKTAIDHGEASEGFAAVKLAVEGKFAPGTIGGSDGPLREIRWLAHRRASYKHGGHHGAAMQVIPPVFERELRVAARRRATYWTRLAVAAVATIVGTWLLLAMQFSSVRQPSDISQTVFATVSGLTALYCLLAGLLSTADCISSEKREGTLGLLFLTDLKGYDVILGKMLATSLNSFYSLTAIFPVLAIPLMLGGIPAGVFVAMTAFLVNVLFLSLSAGMLVSVLGRHELRTVGWTLLLLLFFVGGIPLLGLVGTDLWYRFGAQSRVHELFTSKPPPWTLWPSPVFGYFQLMDLMFSPGTAKTFWSAGFWPSMITIHASGWLFLGLASIRLPFSWQDRALSVARTRLRERVSRWSHGSAGARALFRRTLLDVNAFFWLAARNRLKPWAVWLLLTATALFWLWGWYYWRSDFTEDWVLVLIALWLHTSMKLWLASESCQRMAEDHRSGALELLLSTPLSVLDILRGQWLALRRQFLGPTLAILALDILLMFRAGAGRNSRELLYFGLAGMVVLVADLAALAWVGVWRGLRTRNASRAAAGAIGQVMILPWILHAVLLQIVSILSARIISFRWGTIATVGFWLTLSLCVDAFLVFNARRNLLSRFRELATQRVEGKPRRWWPFGKDSPVKAG
jgi:ABC-type transport system involved in cytochrome c biogenesis permease component